jgi:hypothetical protein
VFCAVTCREKAIEDEEVNALLATSVGKKKKKKKKKKAAAAPSAEASEA